MDYAIETLKKERVLIDKCLNGWEKDHYPEARKIRTKRLLDLDNAIAALERANLDRKYDHVYTVKS